MGYARGSDLERDWATCTHLHEEVPTRRIIFRRRVAGFCRSQRSQFIEAFRDAIDVNKPCDVFVVAEMSKKGELAQRAFRQGRLCENTRDHLDCNCLSGDLVCS